MKVSIDSGVSLEWEDSSLGGSNSGAKSSSSQEIQLDLELHSPLDPRRLEFSLPQ